MGRPRGLEASLTRLLCGGDSHEVTVRSSPQGIRVVVDGKPFDVDVLELADGTFLERAGTRSRIFHCVRDGDTIHLFWQGTVYRLEEGAETSRRAHRVTSGEVEAGMPGKVIDLKAGVGQFVKKGDEILVVESMKMENAIRAPRDGRIKSIAAKVGDMVGPGRVLVEIE